MMKHFFLNQIQFTMKTTFIAALMLLMSASVWANIHSTNQNDRGFNYQAVARNSDGEIMSSEYVNLRFSLYPGTHSSTPDWLETHITTTDEYGVFSLTIGKGVKERSTVEKFSDLDFASFEYWLKVEIKENSAWVEVSFSALQSVPYAEAAGNGIMAGMILPFAGAAENIPAGWALCDGTQLSRTAYPSLFNAIGTAWGHGDGSTTFHLPDLQGLFLRGVDGSESSDPDRNRRTAINTGGNTGNQVGSLQRDQFRSHNHGGFTSRAGAHTHKVMRGGYSLRWGDGGGNSNNYIDAGGSPASSNSSITTNLTGDHRHSITPSGGNETRPINAYVNYIIKL